MTQIAAAPPDTVPETPASNVTPISSAVELLVQLLKQSSLVTRPMVEGVAAPNGMTATELKIMMCLGGEGALAGHEISEVMAIPPMNVSRAIAALEARGWIEAVRDPANKRRKPVQLSGAGWDAYRGMIPDVAEVAAQLLGGLTASERASLARITGKVIARMEGWDGR